MLVGALLVIRAIADAFYVYVPQYRFRNDFRLLYGAVLTTFHDGYSHLYDPIAQRAAVEGLGPGFYWSLFLNPPPLVWLATPLAALPFSVAIILWTILLLAAAGLTWYLAAPGAGLADDDAEGHRKQPQPQQEMRHLGERLGWSEQVPSPDQRRQQERGPDGQRDGEWNREQRRHKPRERRRRDERLGVEAGAQALDCGLLRAQVVQVAVALLKSHHRRGVGEPQVVANRVLRKEGRGRQEKIPCHEDQPDDHAHRRPQAAPSSQKLDHRHKVKRLGPEPEPL